MRKLLFAVLVFFIIPGKPLSRADLRFEKLTEHCYYLASPEGAGNVAAVVTEEGTLLVDPPTEKNRAVAVWDSLKSVASAGPVRWIVFTDPKYVSTPGACYFAERGAVFLASSRLHKLSVSALNKIPKELASAEGGRQDNDSAGPPGPAWFIFGSEIRLFPSDLEIRVFALKSRARTGGDVFVFIPAEKVLLVGRMYEAERYPEIDVALDGDAAGWVEGLKQIIDSVPVLKPAIAQAKPLAKTEPEKSFEEGVIVISSFGRVSNLREMKDLLDICQKLQGEVSRAIKRGRNCASFLAAPAAAAFRVYANLDSYACRLFEANR